MKHNNILISRITRAAKVLLCGCMVAMTCSCEDFLTIYPTDRIVEQDFWKTKGDVENVAAESYRLMSQSNFLYRLLVWGELRGDNVVEGNFGGNNDIINIIDANLLPSNSYASWAPFYEVINNCNIVLECADRVLVEDPDFTLGDYETICGEMYAIRALCHFYLVRTFRDIPLILEAKMNSTQELYQGQENPIVVLDSCLQDLYKAEQWVLASGNYIGLSEAPKNKGRITKDAVRAIIADVLLWKAAFIAQDPKGNAAEEKMCYDQCIAYCDKVFEARLNYWDANRNESLKDLFSQVTELKEFPYPILFPRMQDLQEFGRRFPQRPYTYLFGGDNAVLGECIFEIKHNTTAENGNKEVPYFYGTANDKGEFNIGLLAASTSLAEVSNSGVYKKSDFRRVTYINSEYGTDKKPEKYPIVKFGYSRCTENRGGMDDSKPEVKRTFGKMSYTFWKYTDGVFSDGQVNWVLYRMSDVMLMKAEALALRNGGQTDLDEAFQLVDAVYTRSQMGHSYGNGIALTEPDDKDMLHRGDYPTQEAMYELVLKERQRELAFEGKRWYDLVRVALHDNSTDRILTIIQAANNNPEYFSEYRMKLASIDHLFFPIAEREINVSKGTLKQNTVYDVGDLYGDAN